uniref:Reverse transcriptase domain-containing protein n=1 Tax=Tanacetum cinerariifolium TaxID=118510 RepID=A0A6L2JG73_TANCI|nr:hypothetical protein [Tanacetum cinerariifolium]
MIVEMADKTRCIPEGILENVVAKIDKFSFPFDFVIIDTKESSNKTIILGRLFLATIHTEINVFTRKVSLRIKEDRIKIKMNKQDFHFTTSISENLSNKHLEEGSTSQEIRVNIYDTDLNESCIQDNQLHDELNKLGGRTGEKTITEDQEDPEKCRETMTRAIIKVMVNKLPEEWFSRVSEDKDDLEGIIDYLEPTLYDGFIDLYDEAYKQRRNNKFRGGTGEKTITKYPNDPKKCWETMTRAIIGSMVNKLPEEWFLGVNEDKDDLEGIIDYLEPTLYDGIIDPDDEAYKQRRNKLLGMPYSEPPLILKEGA